MVTSYNEPSSPNPANFGSHVETIPNGVKSGIISIFLPPGKSVVTVQTSNTLGEDLAQDSHTITMPSVNE